MEKFIDVKNCRLAGDMLHIKFTNGESYVFSLGEIVEQCAGGLTSRAVDFAVCTCTTRATANMLIIDKQCLVNSQNR